jgi:hypothetical protein
LPKINPESTLAELLLLAHLQRLDEAERAMLVSATANESEARAIQVDGQRSWMNGHNMLGPELLQKFTCRSAEPIGVLVF